MDCPHANLLLIFYRPDRPSDLSAEDAAALQTHLAGCPACAAKLAKQTAEDRFLSAAVRNVPVPSGLADRLKQQAQSQLKWAWRRTAMKYALAASLLVAGYVGYVAATRPSLDVGQLADAQDTLWQSPDRTATAWLTANGLTNALPEDFDLNLVTFTGRSGLQGVPTLAMRLDAPGRNHAWVYFLRPGDFNHSKAETGQYTSNVGVKVYRDLPNGWTAVVLYTGNSLNTFLRPPGSTI
ncbi:anti-sigma factor family protein [Limnoglobus roseus]|uniref:Putative zinc-finger domain-containing protein n=1 Tax=Limnoglobus roseus TaxID=2598579 RepID=A0A5C1A483_9BACT|nr:zf-HC2 domain-containing protein [Limnoglobus roseus]QEL13911.1 hypothetical protein PX52LOC_00771 [Limnoglobus roseus]